MKRLLHATLFLAVTASALAQGQLIFANNPATTCTNCVTGQAAETSTLVGLYIGNVGDSVGSLTLIG